MDKTTQPDLPTPTKEDLLSTIREARERGVYLTLLQLCLVLWPALPWRGTSPDTDSAAVTPRRWPGVPRPRTARQWLVETLQDLAHEGLCYLELCTCEAKELCGCIVVMPSPWPKVAQGKPIQEIGVELPGRKSVALQVLPGHKVARLVRGRRQRPLGVAHLRAEEHGYELEIHALPPGRGLSWAEIQALESEVTDRLLSERAILPPDLEEAVAALPLLGAPPRPLPPPPLAAAEEVLTSLLYYKEPEVPGPDLVTLARQGMAVYDDEEEPVAEPTSLGKLRLARGAYPLQDLVLRQGVRLAPVISLAEAREAEEKGRGHA
jgi:hypothetical protein